MGPKKQEDRRTSQSKLEKHFEASVGALGSGDAALAEEINKKLDKLASTEFIEAKFREVITEKVLNEAIGQLKRELFEHVRREVGKIQQLYTEMKSRVAEAEKEVEVMKSQVSDQRAEIDKICEEEARIQVECRKVKDLLKEREQQMWAQGMELNDIEQYSRRNNLRIYGIDDRNFRETPEETAQKLVSLFHDKLDLDLSVKDIDIAHRMGRFSQTANRPIVCRMVQRVNALKVMRARRKCKGTRVIIREDLTRRNAKLLEKVTALECVKTAWSDNGKVVVMLQNGSKKKVDHNTDLSRLDH